MPRVQKKTKEVRHDPLHAQIAEDDLVQKFGRVSKPGKREKKRAQDADEEQSVSVIPLAVLW
jgi:essential nuclear protein 1